MAADDYRRHRLNRAPHFSNSSLHINKRELTPTEHYWAHSRVVCHARGTLIAIRSRHDHRDAPGLAQRLRSKSRPRFITKTR